jgi:hypothetical protein
MLSEKKEDYSNLDKEDYSNLDKEEEDDGRREG